MTEDRREALDAAKDLTGALKGVSRDIEKLYAYGRTNRRLVVIAIVAVVIALAAITGTAVTLVQVRRNSASIADVQATNVSACRVGNAGRAEQVLLWQHLIQVSSSNPPPHQTPAQKKQDAKLLAAFLAFVKRVFAPRDCAKLYRLDR